jgi:FemAB-related protein (PEP-CTERM system-associated)
MGMLEIREITDNEAQGWTEYVLRNPGAHFYHDWGWKKVLEEAFGYRCFYLVAQEEGKICGVFPLVFFNSRIMRSCLISLLFLNYGGILADNEEITQSLLDEAVEISKKLKAKYIEIRCLDRLNLPLITREHKVTMWLALRKDVEAQWKGLDGKVRNEVKKAQASGLTTRHGKEELLDKFYKVFARNMRDLGTPVIGRIFFADILKYFPAEAAIFIVERKGRAIAAALTLSHGDTIEIPWASSVRAFNRLCPNEFMYWEVIKYAITQGLKNFDFGRCTKDSGTYKFKKQWAGEVKQLYWQYWAQDESGLPTDNPKKSKFAFLITIWRKLPLFIANRLGPYIAKDISIF